MFSYIWPLALVVLSNLFYQICAKSTPEGINPLASVAVSYFVGMVVSIVLYFVLNKDADLIKEFKHLNWASFVLGICIIGLEVGYIYAYKAGWPVSIMQIVQASILAVLLIFVGYFLYHENLTWNKIVGIIVCMGGLALINLK